LDGALVEAGVFDGGGGLNGERLEEIELVEGKNAVGWVKDYEFSEGDAGFVVEGKAEEVVLGREGGIVAASIPGLKGETWGTRICSSASRAGGTSP
jgi:hypothetical protein